MLDGFSSAIRISVFGTSDMKAFNNANTKLDKFAGNFESTAKRVRSAGMKTMLVGLGIAASLAAPAMETGRFNTQIAQTGGLVQATETQLASIADTAQYLGATSMFTANAVAAGQESLVRLGLTADNVSNRTGIMAATISFATGQQQEMADAGAFLVGSMNAMQLPFTQATEVADRFTTVIANSGNNFSTLQESMANSAGTAMSYGQSMDTLLTVLGVLADRQEKGARAGTRLSGTMTKIYTQGAMIKDVLGVDVYDQATGSTRDLITVFGEMQAKLAGMNEEQKNNTLTRIFGQEGIKVFNLLLTSSAEEMGVLRGKIAGSGGAAQTFNDIILSTPTGKWELMKSAISGVTMRIGKYLMPIVESLMEKVTGAANAILGWMQAHPVITKIAVAFAAVAAVTGLVAGGLLLVGGSMLMVSSVAMRLPAEITKIAYSLKLVDSQAVGAIKSLRMLSGAFLKMVAPFAIVIGAVYLLSKAWETNFWGFKDAVLMVWHAIKPVFTFIGGMLTGLRKIVTEVFASSIAVVSAWFTSWHEKLTTGVKPFVLFVGAIAWGMGFVVGVIGRAWNWIKENPIVSGLLFTSLAAFSWPLILKAVKAVWFFGTQTLLAGGKAVTGFVMARMAMVKNAIVSAWAGRQFMLVRASIIAVAVANKIAAAAQWLLNAAMTANPIGIVIGLVAGFIGLMVLLYKKVEPVRNFMDGLWDGFKAGLNQVIGMINAFIKVINKIPGVEIPMIPKLQTTDGTAAAGVPAELSPATAIQNSSVSSTSVDRSIKMGDIHVTAGPNTPAKSVREQIVEALRETAGQDEGVEGLVYG